MVFPNLVLNSRLPLGTASVWAVENQGKCWPSPYPLLSRAAPLPVSVEVHGKGRSVWGRLRLSDMKPIAGNWGHHFVILWGWWPFPRRKWKHTGTYSLVLLWPSWKLAFFSSEGLTGRRLRHPQSACNQFLKLRDSPPPHPFSEKWYCVPRDLFLFVFWCFTAAVWAGPGVLSWWEKLHRHHFWEVETCVLSLIPWSGFWVVSGVPYLQV